MDYRQMLETLESECEKLRSMIREKESEISSFDPKLTELSEKEKILSEKKSPYAKILLKEVQGEVQNLRKQIEPLLLEKQNMVIELEKKEKELQEKQNNPSEFINGEVPGMIATFWKYIEDNKHDIGMKIESTYTIKEVTVFKDYHFERCIIPTGKVGIMDTSTSKWIVMSSEYPFKQKMYDIPRGYLDEQHCKYTDWFNSFIKEFVETLSTEIIQKSQNDTFEVSGRVGMIILTLP